MIMKAKQVHMAGIEVSEVCFGTEHITVAAPEFGGALLAEALESYGVNFWDTDNSYGSTTQVAAALKIVDRKDVVIAAKTFGKTAEEAKDDLKRTLSTLDTDYIDIFLLHEVAAGSLPNLKPALSVLMEAKAAGTVRAVGLSTHSAAIVNEACEIDDIEIICAPLNYEGSRIDEGTLETMLEALDRAHNKCNKGVYVIKVLGAGDLVFDVRRAIEWAKQYKDRIDVFNIGVSSMSEMRENLEILK